MAQIENDKENSFKKWYEDNKDRISEDRKKRYQNDPDYRETALARSADWRARNPTPSRAGDSRFKKINGVTVEAYRITVVGKMIGRTDQTIRDWEAKGIIPKPTVQSAHRYYTKQQISLMSGLSDLIDLVRYEGKSVLQAAIDSKTQEISKKWEEIDEER